MSLDRIRIVLVATSHAGNIGAAARAMKTMGLSRLVLVSPQQFPNQEATARAVGAENVLQAARVCASLDEAIQDCQFVIGTSARSRRIAWPTLAPDEAAVRAWREAQQHEVAILFGRERTGLTNEELDRCQALVHIPTDPDFTSLNLAAAVQIVAYELRRAMLGTVSNPEAAEESLGEPPASAADVQRFYQHLEQVMIETGFLDPEKPKLLMRRLMRLYNRAQLSANEVNILRGILTSMQRPHGKPHS